jgi:hypothetical protein
MSQTFEKFLALPVELRLKIWHHAHPLFPRIIEIRHTTPVWTVWAASSRPPPFKWILSPNINATLLSVNQEALDELLPLYSPDFNPSMPIELPSPHHRIENLLVDWENDTLFFNFGLLMLEPNHIFKEIFGSSAGKVVTEVRVLAGTWSFWKTLVKALSDKQARTLDHDFMCLKQVVVVMMDDRKHYISIGTEAGRLVRFENIEELERLPPGSLSVDVLNALNRDSESTDGFLSIRGCVRRYG